MKTLHKAIEYIDQLRKLLAADDLSRGHVTAPAVLESGGDKENTWCTPLQVGNPETMLNNETTVLFSPPVTREGARRIHAFRVVKFRENH